MPKSRDTSLHLHPNGYWLWQRGEIPPDQMRERVRQSIYVQDGRIQPERVEEGRVFRAYARIQFGKPVIDLHRPLFRGFVITILELAGGDDNV